MKLNCWLTKIPFSFLCIRWWLRKRVKRRQQVVAVFTGTTSKLSNYYNEKAITGSSREPNISEYYDEGTQLYEPFHEISTTGILAGKLSNDTDNNVGNDFVRAIKYGRPLFATLDWNVLEENLLERMIAICSRMLLLTNADNEWSQESQFSILATRVQFGQTYFNVASSLVSNGYAVLTSFSQKAEAKYARICYQTDPVCAQIAMTLMTKDFDLDKEDRQTIYRGKDPTYWTAKAKELITCGLCVPQKGDVGEIAGVLYLLFCGDTVRFEKDNEMKTFRISFSSWMAKVLDPSYPFHENKTMDDTIQASFIQVCTNHLRHPFCFLKNQQILEEWYNAGVAFYAYSQAVAYDLIAPICIQYEAIEGKRPLFCPLLVQVKNLINFSTKDMEYTCEGLEKVMKKANVSIGIGIVLLLGHESPKLFAKQLQGEGYFRKTMKDITTWCKEVRAGKDNVLICCISVPKGDCFGITDFATTSAIGSTSELYESCSIVNQVAKYESDNIDADLDKLIRSKSNTTEKGLLRRMWESFRESNK
jgi:hypothetical protein